MLRHKNVLFFSDFLLYAIYSFFFFFFFLTDIVEKSTLCNDGTAHEVHVAIVALEKQITE